MSERLPRQFGKYVLLRSLARGGMGEIYMAASGPGRGLNKLCVVKKVIVRRGAASDATQAGAQAADESSADPARLNRFLDEARAVLRLSHGNLVSTFDAGDVDGEMYIAMEQVEGKDLREIWNRCVRTRTRIPLDVALLVAREVARALDYVHTYGDLRLVHRDVAPPNILLSYFGEVKLTDFGLARSTLKTEHTTPGVVFGRASYLSPEQARGEMADARTDVYSLAIVTWELLTGQPYLPLSGLDPASSLAVVRNPIFEPPSSRAPWLAQEVDAVLERALHADRQARFQSADEFRRALSEVMAQVAPRADADRVAEFLRGLYSEVIAEERAQREHLLHEILPRFRGEPLASESTPVTSLFPSTGLPERPPDDGGALSLAIGPESVTRLAPSGFPVPAGAAERLESLHESALRARAGFRVRRLPDDDVSGGPGGDGDAPTRVWRRAAETDDEAATSGFVGRVINHRYRIRQRIGEGGMGAVYAAEHVEIGKSVAVKILHAQYSGDAELVERFRREARAASRVGHPHIIDVTDFGTTEDGCAFFVMELLDGMDLADVLAREGRLDPERAVHIAVQVCRALQAAHDAGIIHRDLKPENIFLVARDGETDFVKVLDFGIAQNLALESGRLTNPGVAMGTPEYMSPEQAMARPVDRRSDVYALAALAYEMLLGVAPYKDGPPERILERKAIALPPMRLRRADIAPALDGVIRQALEPDPDSRPQTMAQFEYELTKAVWGRGRAVAELLGLRVGSRQELETPEPSTAPPTWVLPHEITSADLAEEATEPFGQEGDQEGDQADDQEGDQAGDHAGDKDVGGSRAEVEAADPPSAPSDGASQPPEGALWLERPSAGRASVHADPPAGVSPSAAPVRGGSRWRSVTVLVVALLAGGAAVLAWSMRYGPPRLVRVVLPWVGSRVAGLHAPVTNLDSRSASSRKSPPAGPLVASSSSSSSSSSFALSSSFSAAPLAVGRASTGQDAAQAPERPAPPPLPSPASAPVDIDSPAERARIVDVLVAAGWQDIKVFRWLSASRRARDALAVTTPRGEQSRGAHALLGEALFALHDYRGALQSFTEALAESPGDARLKRRVIRSRRQLPEGSASVTAESAAEQ